MHLYLLGSYPIVLRKFVSFLMSFSFLSEKKHITRDRSYFIPANCSIMRIAHDSINAENNTHANPASHQSLRPYNFSFFICLFLLFFCLFWHKLRFTRNNFGFSTRIPIDICNRTNITYTHTIRNELTQTLTDSSTCFGSTVLGSTFYGKK